MFAGFGDKPDAIDADKFLTNVLVYWFTGTAASSIRLYYENAHDPEAWSPKPNSGVPTGVAVFARDEVAIRRFGEDRQQHRSLDRTRQRRPLRGDGSPAGLGQGSRGVLFEPQGLISTEVAVRAATSIVSGPAGFACNGYAEPSPGGYSMVAALICEIVPTAADAPAAWQPTTCANLPT